VALLFSIYRPSHLSELAVEQSLGYHPNSGYGVISEAVRHHFEMQETFALHDGRRRSHNAGLMSQMFNMFGILPYASGVNVSTRRTVQ
jgi:hypothetical protein